MAHAFIKPEVILPAYAAVLNTELDVAKLFNGGNFDQFKGAKNDTVTVRVPGRLPARKGYQFRGSDKRGAHAEDIVFDEYSESSFPLTLNGHAYSAVQIIDEQVNFDLKDANSLVPVQARALAAQLNKDCASQVATAPYQFTIGGAQYNLRRALIEARRLMNGLSIPDEQRILLVGGDFEAELLSDEKLTFASQVGDNQAASALHQATLGSLFGFRIVVSQAVPAGEAYAIIPSAFVLRTAVPVVPDSVAFGKAFSADGVGVRWMRQYNLRRFQDESVADLYYGTEVVKDVYNSFDETATPNKEAITDTPLFLRGVKLTLDGTSATNATVAADLSLGSVWQGAAPVEA